MTETRKPYEPSWPHGYETRDGRKVEYVGSVIGHADVWRLPDGELFTTAKDGRRVFGDPFTGSSLDIFCTPAPVVERAETWANMRRSQVCSLYDRLKDAQKYADIATKAGNPYERPAVHLREVRDGDMTAEQVEALVKKITDSPVVIRTDYDAGVSWCLSYVAELLRAASRGEA